MFKGACLLFLSRPAICCGQSRPQFRDVPRTVEYPDHGGSRGGFLAAQDAYDRALAVWLRVAAWGHRRDTRQTMGSRPAAPLLLSHKSIPSK
jgi:hypothetical protein